MSVIEEQIWNYIDGNCSLTEKEIIAAKIANNSEYSRLYESLKAIDEQLLGLDIEEPSMSFTRNVMDSVKGELKPVALQTKVNHKIVFGIAALFIAALLLVLGFAISLSDFKPNTSLAQLNFSVAITQLINPISLKIFLFFDVGLALVYVDSLLRKGTVKKS